MSVRVTVPLLLITVAVMGLGVVSGALDAVDYALIAIVRDPVLDRPLAFLHVMTEAGSTWAVTGLAIGLIAVLLVRRRPWDGVAAASFILATSVVNTVAKSLIARARPDLLEPLVEERGFAFPSGHAMTGMAAWGILAVVLWRARLPPVVRRLLGLACALIVALIGVSRVYLGVHHPSDVIAGWVAGAIAVLLFARVTQRGNRLAEAAAVSPAASEPTAGGAGADREAPRSDPPAAG